MYLSFDDVTKTINGMVAYQGLTRTAAHIHKGACGVAGAPEITLTVGPSPMTVSGTLTTAQETALVANELYVNLHTAGDPDGRVRGPLHLMSNTITCPAGGADAGVDSGMSSGSSGTSGTSGTSGASSTSGGGGDGGGCSTTGSDASNGLLAAFAGILAFAFLGRARARHTKR